MGRLFGRLAALLFLTFGLSACAIPPAVSLISLAADGVLLAATGKSKTDHGMSIATGRDCVTFRALEGEDVCQDIVIAHTEPMPAAISRELDSLRVAAPRDRDFAAADTAMMTAFRAAPPVPVVLAAAPRQAPAVQAGVPAAIKLAALRVPQTGATPGRIKLDRSATARAVVAVAAKAGPTIVAKAGPTIVAKAGAVGTTRFVSAKTRFAVVKNSKHVAQAKGKRFAAVKTKRVAALKAKQQPRLGAVTRPVEQTAITPQATLPFAAPATLSWVMPAPDGDQLALAP